MDVKKAIAVAVPVPASAVELQDALPDGLPRHERARLAHAAEPQPYGGQRSVNGSRQIPAV